MRTLPEQQPTPALEVPPVPVIPTTNVETFSATLRGGKLVTIREMTGKDLVYIEEELANLGETRKSFHIIELLNVGENKISYGEIESLGVRDIKIISDLISKANGDTQDSSEEAPK